MTRMEIVNPMNDQTILRPSIRCNSRKLNHHIWNNHGIWWCHFTLRSSLGASKRVRRSLKTRDVAVAREKRDRIFAALTNASGGIAA